MMPTWNHRIVQKKDPEGDLYCEVHEAHYNAKGDICAITENAVTALGETVEELETELQRMAAACKKPVLIDGEIEFAPWDVDEDETP